MSGSVGQVNQFEIDEAYKQAKLSFRQSAMNAVLEVHKIPVMQGQTPQPIPSIDQFIEECRKMEAYIWEGIQKPAAPPAKPTLITPGGRRN